MKISFDENLREVILDPENLDQHILFLQKEMKTNPSIVAQVNAMGELGVWLRIKNNLNEAEQILNRAIDLIQSHSLGIKREIQQKIRLAHVYQWQKNFSRSNALFSELIQVCRVNSDAHSYLDFAMQHSGKNLFDQSQFAEARIQFEEALHLRKAKGAPSEQIQSTEHALQMVNKKMLQE